MTVIDLFTKRKDSDGPPVPDLDEARKIVEDLWDLTFFYQQTFPRDEFRYKDIQRSLDRAMVFLDQLALTKEAK